MARPDPPSLIDSSRYPVGDLDSPAARAVIEAGRKSRIEKGVAILPGFVTADTLGALCAEVEALLPKSHYEDVAVGTPYLGLPDESFPEGHPRRHTIHSATSVIAYDLMPEDSVLRALYEWDPLLDFIGEILERRPIYRMDDPLGALNLTAMHDGDVQGWHYDSTDFVVSLAVRASEGGGEFECSPLIRREGEEENYDVVGRVLRGEAPERVEVFPFTPGTLMIFEGRNSLHRVSPVRGGTPRYVALMGYDTRPGTDSSDLLKMVRYGRTSAF